MLIDERNKWKLLLFDHIKAFECVHLRSKIAYPSWQVKRFPILIDQSKAECEAVLRKADLATRIRIHLDLSADFILAFSVPKVTHQIVSVN